MIKKLTILVLIIFGLTSCGYSPMYSGNNETNFEIYDLELKGDRQINNIIKSRLEKYFNNNKEKKYIIKVRTNYEKNSVTKDRTGSTTHFKLIVKLTLDYKRVGVNQNEKEPNKQLSFSESTIIKKNQDNFEQNDYENITIKNISELLINKVILYLERS